MQLGKQADGMCPALLVRFLEVLLDAGGCSLD